MRTPQLPLQLLALFSLASVSISTVAIMDCVVLSAALPGLVFLPGTPEYTESTGTYFAAFENELKPRCVLQPRSSDEVSKVIKYLVLTPTNVKIAIRGGGHTPWAGAANIQDGLSLDLRKLKGVKLSLSNTVASISAGERWSSVYSTLEKEGLAVAGGRVSKVGVSGLILGGGLSYFSQDTGFVTDNVINFEVVLSNGDIVQANPKTNTDLYFALKGGNNNFGVVTRFDLPTFKQGRMWGGAIYSLPTAFPELAEKLYNYASDPNPDPTAHLIVAAAFAPSMAVSVINVYHTNSTPNPPTLAPFTAVQPQLFGTIREDSLLGFADEQAAFSTDGDRQLYFTTTFRPNLSFLLDIYNLYQATVETYKHIPGFTLSLVFQPMSKRLLQASAARGGNSLGLSPDRGPLLINLINSVHTNKADDAEMIKAVTDLLKSIEDLAAQRGLADRYRFMNYSFKGAKVIEGYGADNVQKLKAVSKKYDKSGFFQQSVPGGYKLPA